MSVIQAADIADLVASTQKDLGKMKFTQIATSLQDYPAMRSLIRKNRVQFDSGTGIQRNVMLRHSGAARHAGLYDQDAVNVADVMATIDIPWRHSVTNYAVESHEVTMNTGGAQIVDLVKIRRTDAMISLTELMESTFWGQPSSDDNVTPFGILYWLVYSASTGFNGGNNSLWASGPGNLSSTTYANWKNYTAQYTAVSKDDLITKMRSAFRLCTWTNPVSIPDYDIGGMRRQIYVNEATIAALETIGEAQNDSLGRDLASMDGKILFHGTPVNYVPQLDDYGTADPVYMIDWSCFHPVILRGWYMKETGPKPAPNQHNVLVTFVDLSWNLLCTNRRRQALIAKSDPVSG